MMLLVNYLEFPPIVEEDSIQKMLVMLTALGWMFLQGVLRLVASPVLLLAHKDLAQWMFSILHILFLVNLRFLWIGM